MDFKDLVQRRRSIRKFTDQPLDKEEVHAILRAALMSPTSKSSRAWQFVVVDDTDTLARLAQSKSAGAEFLSGAPLAVVVCGNAEASDVWVEDASIAAISMQYQAADLGLGSCWAQMRLRGQADGTPADEAIRDLLHLPDTVCVLCVVGFGHPAMERKPQDEEKLKWENVHINEW